MNGSPHVCRIRPKNEVIIGDHVVRYRRYLGDDTILLLINSRFVEVKLGVAHQIDQDVSISVSAICDPKWGWRYDMYTYAPKECKIFVRRID